MPSSVDNRVVQMEFDNDSFEKGIAQSLESLEAIHKKLDSGITAKGLDELVAKMNGLSFENLGAQIGTVETKANGLVSVLKATIDELGGLGGTLSKGALGWIFGTVASGGSRRASNIEQAKFQLQGLTVAWSDVEGAIKHAVEDTAYGLDEAAKAAAQFTASGIKDTEDLKIALRGISGAAAMTNSSYDEMAQIFTTVAGNGRLFAMQLNQLGSRGLNAAAVLAEKLHVTEQEVRDMTSKGQIDFATFAEAMDEAFGTHAKDANQTLTGAFANMKASFSRIGADFIAPVHEMERQVYLGIRSMVDNVRSGLNELVDITEANSVMGIFGEQQAAYLTQFEEGLIKEGHTYASIISNFETMAVKFGQTVQEQLEGITESGVLKRFVAAFTWALDGVMELAFGVSEQLVKIFAAIIKAFPTDTLAKILNPIGNIARSLNNFLYPLLDKFPAIVENIIGALDNLINGALSVIGPVLMGVLEGIFGTGEDLYSFFDGFVDKVVELTGHFREFTESVKLSDEASAGLRSAVSGISSAFSGVFGKAVQIVASVLDKVFSTVSKLQPVFSAIGNLISAVVTPVFKFFGDALKGIGDTIAGFLGVDLEGELFDTSTVEGWANAINGAADVVREFFDGLNFDEAASKIGELFDGLVDLEGIGTNLADVWKQLKDVLAQILDDIGRIASGDFDFENSFLGQIVKFFDGKFDFGGIGDLVKSLFGAEKAYADTGEFTSFGDTFQNEADKASNAASTLKTGVFDVVKTGLDEVGESASGFTEAFKVDNIFTPISLAITGFMTGSMMSFVGGITQLPRTMNDFVQSLGAPFKKAGELIDTFSKSIKDIANAISMKIKGGVFQQFAIGIALIAASLLILSIIPADKIEEAVKRLLVVVATVGLIVVAIEVMFHSIGNLAKELDAKQMATVATALGSFAALVLAISASIMILSLAIGLLSLIPEDAFMRAAITIGVLVAAMIALAAVVGHSKELGTQILQMAALFASVGFAILALAAGILIFSMIPWSVIQDGLTKLAVGFLVLIGAVTLVALAVSKFQGPMLGAAATIMAFALAIIPLVAAIMLLSSIPFDKAISGAFALGIGLVAMAAGIALISRVARAGLRTMLGTVPVILAMSLAVLALAGALLILSTIPDVGPGVMAIGIMMTGLVLAIAGLMALAAVITDATGIVGALLGVVPIMLSAVAVILALSAAVIALSVGLAIISSIPDAGPALMTLGIALAMLVAAAAGLALVGPGLVAVGIAAMAIGAGILLAATGVLLFTGALAMLAAILPGVGFLMQSALGPVVESLGDAMVTMAGKVAEAIAAFTSKLAEAGPQLATASGQLAISMAQGITTAAPALATAGVSCIVSFVEGLASRATDLAYAGLQLVSNLILGIAQGIGGLIDAGIKLALALVTGIADGIRNNAGLMEAALTDVTGTIFGLLEGLIADGIEAIFGPNPVADAIRESAEQQIANAEEASAKVHEALSSENDAIVEDQQNTMNEVVSATEEGGDKMEQAANEAASNFSNIFSTGLNTSLEDMDIGSMISGKVDLSGLTAVGESGGQSLGSGFTSSAETGLAELSSMFKGKSEAAVQSAGSVDSSGAGSQVGSNFGSGMLGGMDAWIGPIASKAAEMVNAAKAAANEAQDSASPSKDMMKVGGWFGEGYYIGMGLWIKPISDRAYDMASSAKRSVIETTGYLSEMWSNLDMDSGPVITPVLDLSEVEDGMGRMGRLLTDGEATRFMNLSGMMAAAANGGYYNNVITNNYDLTLDWQAGQDANDALRDLNQALKARNMTGGKHGR